MQSGTLQKILFAIACSVAPYSFSSPQELPKKSLDQIKAIALQVKKAIKSLLSMEVRPIQIVQASLESINPSDEQSKNLLEKLKRYLALFINELRLTKNFKLFQKKQIETHLLKTFDRFGKQILWLLEDLESDDPEAHEIAKIIKRIPQEITCIFRKMRSIDKIRFGLMLLRGRL